MFHSFIPNKKIESHAFRFLSGSDDFSNNVAIIADRTAENTVFRDDRNISRTLLETPIKGTKAIFNEGQAVTIMKPLLCRIS